MELNYLSRKKRFNRLLLGLYKKEKVSSLDAATWWKNSSHSSIQFEDNNYCSYNLNVKPLDGKELPEFFSWSKPVITRPRFIYSYKNAVISPIESHIYLIDIDKSTIDLGSKFDCTRSIFDFYSRKELKDSPSIKGNILHLGISSPPNNFWHWMHEIYARIIRIKDQYDLNYFDYIIMPKISHTFQREALKLMKINENKLLYFNGFIKCEGSLYTLNIDNIGSSNDLSRYFKSNILSGEHFEEKIFLDRHAKSGNQNRELINFEESKLKYINAGYKFIFPEELSFSEQVRLFQGARSLVGVSGSAFTLAGLMPQQSKLVEIFSKNFVDPAISMNCAASKILYGFYVEGSYRPNQEEGWQREFNCKIDSNLINHNKVIDFLD